MRISAVVIFFIAVFACVSVLAAAENKAEPAKGYVTDIEDATKDNAFFRRVLFTGPHSQLVVMSLKPGEDIGMETHEEGDQFIRVEEGEGRAILNGKEYRLEDDWAIVIPAGTRHNIINTGNEQLKFYVVYSPPEHPDGTIHKTKEEAMKAEQGHKKEL